MKIGAYTTWLLYAADKVREDGERGSVKGFRKQHRKGSMPSAAGHDSPFGAASAGAVQGCAKMNARWRRS